MKYKAAISIFDRIQASSIFHTLEIATLLVVELDTFSQITGLHLKLIQRIKELQAQTNVHLLVFNGPT